MVLSQMSIGTRQRADALDKRSIGSLLSAGKVVAYVGRVGADGETFQERLGRLMREQNLTPFSLARKAKLSRNAVVWLLDGTTKTPTIQSAEALAKALDASSIYLMQGREADEDESITTMEQLHSWEMKIVRQRERYMRRILQTQQERMASTLRLTPEQSDLMEQLAHASQADEASLGGTPLPPGPADLPAKKAARGDTAA